MANHTLVGVFHAESRKGRTPKGIGDEAVRNDLRFREESPERGERRKALETTAMSAALIGAALSPERGERRKALETGSVAPSSTFVDGVPKGANAERHWRLVIVAGLHFSPRGGPERGERRKALETMGVGAAWVRSSSCPERGERRKALETSF